MTLLLKMLPCNTGGLEIGVSFLVSKVLYLLHLPLQLEYKTQSFTAIILYFTVRDDFERGIYLTENVKKNFEFNWLA